MFGLYIFYVVFSSCLHKRAEFPSLLLYGTVLENDKGCAASAMFTFLSYDLIRAEGKRKHEMVP
jgi:hypothetical protein